MKPDEFFYPEIKVGGFSRVDGTVAFYQRVRALLTSDTDVLDFGAGRGGALKDDRVEYRRKLRKLQGEVRSLTVCDVDDVVMSHPAADRRVVLQPSSPLPFDDQQFGLILCDFVFEHIDSPDSVASELGRVLRSGGWICARTTNKWGYVSLGSSLMPTKLHSWILGILQPSRRRGDVFPAKYRMNSPSDIRRLFPPSAFTLTYYYGSSEPAYAGSSWLLYPLFYALHWALPPPLQTTLYVFLRKQ